MSHRSNNNNSNKRHRSDAKHGHLPMEDDSTDKRIKSAEDAAARSVEKVKAAAQQHNDAANLRIAKAEAMAKLNAKQIEDAANVRIAKAEAMAEEKAEAMAKLNAKQIEDAANVRIAKAEAMANQNAKQAAVHHAAVLAEEKQNHSDAHEHVEIQRLVDEAKQAAVRHAAALTEEKQNYIDAQAAAVQRAEAMAVDDDVVDVVDDIELDLAQVQSAIVAQNDEPFLAVTFADPSAKVYLPFTCELAAYVQDTHQPIAAFMRKVWPILLASGRSIGSLSLTSLSQRQLTGILTGPANHRVMKQLDALILQYQKVFVGAQFGHPHRLNDSKSFKTVSEKTLFFPLQGKRQSTAVYPKFAEHARLIKALFGVDVTAATATTVTQREWSKTGLLAKTFAAEFESDFVLTILLSPDLCIGFNSTNELINRDDGEYNVDKTHGGEVDATVRQVPSHGYSLVFISGPRKAVYAKTYVKATFNACKAYFVTFGVLREWKIRGIQKN